MNSVCADGSSQSGNRMNVTEELREGVIRRDEQFSNHYFFTPDIQKS